MHRVGHQQRLLDHGDQRRHGLLIAHHDLQRGHQLEWSARTGTISVQGQLFTVSQPKRGNGSPANSAKADFNGDSMADLLWQNDNGAVGLWKMNGLSAG